MRARPPQWERVRAFPVRKVPGEVCDRIPSALEAFGVRRVLFGWQFSRGTSTFPCPGCWRRVGTPCPVLKHGPRSARGTRVWRVVSVRLRPIAFPRDPREAKWEQVVVRSGARAPLKGASQTEPLVTPWPASSESVSVATRKMVNYARGGRSQRKLWWKPAAVLTCKSIVALGYRGERLIEPSSSWFPPKFPSG